jgi:hypothetical protein
MHLAFTPPDNQAQTFIQRKGIIMALQSVTFQSSPASTPIEVYVPEDAFTVESFLRETQGVSDFSIISVEVDGEPANLQDPVTGGMEISIAQKKADSGTNIR